MVHSFLSAVLVECLTVTGSNAEQIDSRVKRAIPIRMMVDKLTLAPVADRYVLNALFQCSIARSQGMFVPFVSIF